MLIKILIYLLFTAAANLLLRCSGIVQSANNLCILGIKVNVVTLCAVLSYGIGFLFLMLIIQNSKLTYMAPILGVLVNTLIVFGAIIFLKESINVTQAIGIIFAIIAIVFLNI